jgi:hypothetical protein
MMASDLGEFNPYSAPDADLRQGVDLDSDRAGGMTFGAFLLIYFCASFAFMAVFWGLFWSAFMSLIMGWKFLPTLVFAGLPGGFIVGLFVSLFIVGYFGLFMRQKTATIPFDDAGEFQDRLGREMKKRRFRPALRSERKLVFVPKALIRTRFFDVVVVLRKSEAAVTGPEAVVKYLSKRLGQGR